MDWRPMTDSKPWTLKRHLLVLGGVLSFLCFAFGVPVLSYPPIPKSLRTSGAFVCGTGGRLTLVRWLKCEYCFLKDELQ